jgi:hypothetical protein
MKKKKDFDIAKNIIPKQKIRRFANDTDTEKVLN